MTFSVLAQRVPPIQQTLESCIYPAWNLYLPEEGMYTLKRIRMYIYTCTCTFSVVYSVSSSASKSVQGFKEYFDFHKSFYDNVRKLITIYVVCMYVVHT